MDLPEPFGPTTAVMPGSNFRAVAEAKDLKPRSVRVLRYTRRRPPRLLADRLACPGRSHLALRGTLPAQTASGVLTGADGDDRAREQAVEVHRTSGEHPQSTLGAPANPVEHASSYGGAKAGPDEKPSRVTGLMPGPYASLYGRRTGVDETRHGWEDS
ncbi:hypothetical protein Sme01_28340 [Sphaerisporangium melleum]|uniref:Uncharacterized protein n=1 Tax=Sphaerisporangium melleum TaxID=321316 RepID=A0A917QVR0_9ACTN|nr:hypothetical protein GCM10007964_11010 [Sphaerisporangium melleum]GII70358.1 hypothetical protein Sme01_28340 [Sphaerisporangium melleum]